VIRRGILVALALTVALASQGCGALVSGIPQATDFPASPGVDPTSQATPSPVPAPAGPPVVGKPAPEWTLDSLAGESVSLSDYRGQAVVLNFWATWCGYCEMEIPHFVALYAEASEEGLVILAVDMMEERADVRAYAEDMGMEFPILLDSQGAVADRYYVRGIPTTVFIDRDGIVRRIHACALTDAQLRDYVSDIMD